MLFDLVVYLNFTRSGHALIIGALRAAVWPFLYIQTSETFQENLRVSSLAGIIEFYMPGSNRQDFQCVHQLNVSSIPFFFSFSSLWNCAAALLELRSFLAFALMSLHGCGAGKLQPSEHQ